MFLRLQKKNILRSKSNLTTWIKFYQSSNEPKDETKLIRQTKARLAPIAHAYFLSISFCTHKFAFLRFCLILFVIYQGSNNDPLTIHQRSIILWQFIIKLHFVFVTLDQNSLVVCGARWYTR